MNGSNLSEKKKKKKKTYIYIYIQREFSYLDEMEIVGLIGSIIVIEVGAKERQKVADAIWRELTAVDIWRE